MIFHAFTYYVVLFDVRFVCFVRVFRVFRGERGLALLTLMDRAYH
jgi:hypothetical protein